MCRPPCATYMGGGGGIEVPPDSKERAPNCTLLTTNVISVLAALLFGAELQEGLHSNKNHVEVESERLLDGELYVSGASSSSVSFVSPLTLWFFSFAFLLTLSPPLCSYSSSRSLCFRLFFLRASLHDLLCYFASFLPIPAPFLRICSLSFISR